MTHMLSKPTFMKSICSLMNYTIKHTMFQPLSLLILLVFLENPCMGGTSTSSVANALSQVVLPPQRESFVGTCPQVEQIQLCNHLLVEERGRVLMLLDYS